MNLLNRINLNWNIKAENLTINMCMQVLVHFIINNFSIFINNS